MPIKTSGPINFQDIRDEFGPAGNGPMSLDDYRRGGSFVPNKNANSNIPLTGTDLPISLQDFYGATKIITLTFNGYGGGGAGGSGYENGGDGNTGSAGDGGRTGIMLRSVYDNLGALPPNDGDFLQTTSGGTLSRAFADGGAGGANGNGGLGESGGVGEAGEFGPGGLGGPLNSAAPKTPYDNWGSGGGGGGGDRGKGDDYTFFGLINKGGSDDAGGAGVGGRAGAVESGAIDIDVEVDYVVRVGGGGIPATAVGNHDGAAGAPGYLTLNVDTQPGTDFIFSFPDISNPTNNQYTVDRYYGFRVKRNGSVETFDV